MVYTLLALFFLMLNYGAGEFHHICILVLWFCCLWFILFPGSISSNDIIFQQFLQQSNWLGRFHSLFQLIPLVLIEISSFKQNDICVLCFQCSRVEKMGVFAMQES